MWYGWFGFNCGSIGTLEGAHLNSVVRVGVVHTVGGSMGGLVALILDQIARPGEYRPVRMINGVLCALVSISASAAFIEPSLSLFIGGVAGFIYTRASALMLRLKIDDVVDAISIHLFGGIWGIIAASFVSRSGYLRQMNGPTYPGCGAFYGCSYGGKQIATALVYICCILLWVTCTIVPVLLVLRRFNMLRITERAEKEGVDRATHGGDSYEEFQTTIFKLTNKKGEATLLETRVREGDIAHFALLSQSCSTQTSTRRMVRLPARRWLPERGAQHLESTSMPFIARRKTTTLILYHSETNASFSQNFVSNVRNYNKLQVHHPTASS